MNNNITLVADIGATNARFAVSINHGCLELVQVFQCGDYSTPEKAIDSYMEMHNLAHFDRICLAIAGPVVHRVIKLTNHHWVFDIDALKIRYKLDKISILNDFEAIAYSIPELSNTQIIELSSHEPVINHNKNFTYAVMGSGSGFGVSALIRRGDNVYPIVSEGGHVNFSPVTELQIAIFDVLRKKYQQVSNERLLSGMGIVNIYQSLCEIEGAQQVHVTTQQICEAASKSKDGLSIKSLEVFYEILGQVAADITLTFRSFDGVYIAGGIIQRYPELIKKSRFLMFFENKCQHQELLAATPIFLIAETNPGLLGAYYYSKMYM